MQLQERAANTEDYRSRLSRSGGGAFRCRLLTARRSLQEILWPELPPNFLRKCVTYLYRLAAVEMSRKHGSLPWAPSSMRPVSLETNASP
jgi:hypothetical protein